MLRISQDMISRGGGGGLLASLPFGGGYSALERKRCSVSPRLP